MKIYTRTGDDGTTSLAGGSRIPKHHARIEALGSIDELISWLGLLRDLKENSGHKDFLIHLQSQLMKFAAVISSGDDRKVAEKLLPDEESVKAIEDEIDKMAKDLIPLEYFIIPGGNVIVSYCHIARCVCRRAERKVLKLYSKNKIIPLAGVFLNRLSDYLFILSRKISSDLDIEETNWLI
ncbi:MAG TPA: cob(I)yrinic acid a,c-diamide adenosyltransferase [Bacteroidales bacterium]|jgi:cob(I)alamin adenosyltransferase|nr:cob(I)yrinic acid a,c-diamide adenosyltransferase [Bacteroidales bacterium]HQH25296.1 cob(I)yrinic acid a,c-diamide adenosyltransferase [Bacteroidales bacterium]HQJ82482.1 cob(I)yrinic acid a,c-diamide adenosyltransferase [Bacteroidales bacterium]